MPCTCEMQVIGASNAIQRNDSKRSNLCCKACIHRGIELLQSPHCQLDLASKYAKQVYIEAYWVGGACFCSAQVGMTMGCSQMLAHGISHFLTCHHPHTQFGTTCSVCCSPQLCPAEYATRSMPLQEQDLHQVIPVYVGMLI